MGKRLTINRRTAIQCGAGIVVLIVLLVFAVTVWPTIYQYHQLKIGGNTLLVRVHRILGTTEILWPSGWTLAPDSKDEPAAPTNVPSTERATLKDVPSAQNLKLQATADVADSKLSCTIYNGSEWRIREIVVHISVFDSTSPKPVLERDYRVSDGYFAEPLTTCLFSQYVGFDLAKDQHFSWYIKSAKGQPQ